MSWTAEKATRMFAAIDDSKAARAEYADRLRNFIDTECVGRQYDSCINSPCPYASVNGCQHPNHPKHQRRA